MRIPVHSEDADTTKAAAPQPETEAPEITIEAVNETSDLGAQDERSVSPEEPEAPEQGPASEEEPDARPEAEAATAAPATRDTVEQVDPEELTAEQLRTQLKRLSADFENARRRSRAEVAASQKRGQDLFLAGLVPVIVDLQSALSHSTKEQEKGLREGLEMVLEKLFAQLQVLGYLKINTADEKMDPRRHEALFTVPAGEGPSGVVKMELAPGFERDGRVVIPAKVAVSKAG